jgi:hypothetical protein
LCRYADKGESYESSQSSIKKQGSWRRQLSVSNTSGEVYEEEWSKMQNGRHILREVADFEEYSHGPKTSKELRPRSWQQLCGVHMKDKAKYKR